MAGIEHQLTFRLHVQFSGHKLQGQYLQQVGLQVGIPGGGRSRWPCDCRIQFQKLLLYASPLDFYNNLMRRLRSGKRAPKNGVCHSMVSRRTESKPRRKPPCHCSSIPAYIQERNQIPMHLPPSKRNLLARSQCLQIKTLTQVAALSPTACP